MRSSDMEHFFFYMSKKTEIFIKSVILTLIAKNRRSCHELCQDMLGICQNKVPEFDGDIFETMGVVFLSIKRFFISTKAFLQKYIFPNISNSALIYSS